MKLKPAERVGYGDIPIGYVLELGGEEFLGLRDNEGNFQQIASLGEIPVTDWWPVEMFGPSLGLLIPCYADIVIDDGVTIGRVGVRIADGKPACTSIVAVPGKGLTGALLRQLPLAVLVQEAAITNTVRVLEIEGELFGARYVEGGPGFGSLHDDLRRELAAVGERSRRRVIDDAFLAEVARVYREAFAWGRPPALAVEDALGPTTPTNARRWIAAARREGFLGPAPAARRAGELAHEEHGSS
jgi:hypothetical protein